MLSPRKRQSALIPHETRRAGRAPSLRRSGARGAVTPGAAPSAAARAPGHPCRSRPRGRPWGRTRCSVPLTRTVSHTSSRTHSLTLTVTHTVSLTFTHTRPSACTRLPAPGGASRPGRQAAPPLTEEPEDDLEPNAEPALAGIVVRVEDGVDDVEAGHPERHFERCPGLLMGHPHLLLRGPHRCHEPLPHRGWAGRAGPRGAGPGRRPGAGAEAAAPPPPPRSLTTRPPPARVSRAGAGGGGSREASGCRCSRLAKAWLLLPPPPPPPAEPPS